MTFWNFTFFRKTFLDQSLWIFKWVSWWCYLLTIFYTFHYRNDKNLIFQPWDSKHCLISTQNKWEIMFSLIYFDTRICFYLYLQKILNFSKFHVQYTWQIVRRWHHQLAHLNIHKDWSRNVFRKNVKFQNVITSLFSIRFSSFLHRFVGENFLFLLKIC